MTSPQVSSAVASEAVPWWRSEEITIPSSVQGVTSMCGYTLRWLISRRLGADPGGRRGFRALPDQNDGLGIAETIHQLVDVLGVVVPHRDLMILRLGEAFQCPECVEVVVKDRYPRSLVPLRGDVRPGRFDGDRQSFAYSSGHGCDPKWTRATR